MIIGVPTEIKTREYRVGINPGGVVALVRAGHKVRIQKGAGLGAGITDKDFEGAGATIVPSADDAWGAELVMKVKEPLPAEYKYFRPGLILYTYLHLAPLPELTAEPTPEVGRPRPRGRNRPDPDGCSRGTRGYRRRLDRSR